MIRFLCGILKYCSYSLFSLSWSLHRSDEHLWIWISCHLNEIVHSHQCVVYQYIRSWKTLKLFTHWTMRFNLNSISVKSIMGSSCCRSKKCIIWWLGKIKFRRPCNQLTVSFTVFDFCLFLLIYLIIKMLKTDLTLQRNF